MAPAPGDPGKRHWNLTTIPKMATEEKMTPEGEGGHVGHLQEGQ